MTATANGRNSVLGLEHQQSPVGGHMLKAEEAQQEIEAAGEEASSEGLHVTSHSSSSRKEDSWSSHSHMPVTIPVRIGVLDPLGSLDRPEHRDKAQGTHCSLPIYILFQDFFDKSKVYRIL